LGTLTPFCDIIEKAHAVGAEVFLDAVHYAPHMALDVHAWKCDYLACSAYKFFGPHVGALWGKRNRLEELSAYKVRPATNSLPGKWMTGTQNHEGIAGVAAAVNYLASIGAGRTTAATSRRKSLLAAFKAIGEYERGLVAKLISGLKQLPHIRIWGLTEPSCFSDRVPTVAITHESIPSSQLARLLADRGIFTWSGNYYALPLTEAFRVEPEGFVRIGLLHYNTLEEVDRFLGELSHIV
jgi:selenocysteine lyase/cysteine desulfurase